MRKLLILDWREIWKFWKKFQEKKKNVSNLSWNSSTHQPTIQKYRVVALIVSQQSSRKCYEWTTSSLCLKLSSLILLLTKFSHVEPVRALKNS